MAATSTIPLESYPIKFQCRTQVTVGQYLGGVFLWLLRIRWRPLFGVGIQPEGFAWFERLPTSG